jgi:hypothetical protein
MKPIFAVLASLALATAPAGGAVASDECSSPWPGGSPSWLTCGCAWAECMQNWDCPTLDDCDTEQLERCMQEYDDCMPDNFDCPYDSVCTGSPYDSVYARALRATSAGQWAATAAVNGYYYPRFDVGSSLVFDLAPSLNTLRVGRMHEGAFLGDIGGVTKVEFYEVPIEDLAEHITNSTPWNLLGEGTFNSVLSRWEFPYTVSATDPHVGHVFAARAFDPTAPGGAGEIPALAVGVITTPPPLAMSVQLDPQTLFLGSMGRWVTGYLEPPPPLTAGQIDIGSIRLNGVVPVDPAAAPAIGDHDGNSIPDLMVTFDRGAVMLTLEEGTTVPVTVTGTVDGQSFAGTDAIRVTGGTLIEASVSPNPMNPQATLTFFTTTPGHVRVSVYDPRGRLLRVLLDEQGLPAGYHDVTIDGFDQAGVRLASGVYFYKVESQDGVGTGQFAIMK